MSDFKAIFQVNLDDSGQLPKRIQDYLSLSWMVKYRKAFEKPSPDQAIDLQKSQAIRVPIIAKHKMKLPTTCALLEAAPMLKPKASKEPLIKSLGSKK